jgi:hypothetical protein
MRCKRIRRELLWLARFGELGPSSAPHLEHLSRCGSCRDEVGFDRALVQQLRRALAERLSGEEPPPRTWDVILERAMAPEAGLGGFLRGHAVMLAARLRTATAVSAIALAGIIATSTQVAVTHPEAGSAETEVRTSAAGDQYERQPLVPRPRHIATPVVYVPAGTPSDPEVAFQISATLPPIVAAPEGEPPAEAPSIEAEVSIGEAFTRLTPADSGEGDLVAEPDVAVAPRDDMSAGEPY